MSHLRFTIYDLRNDLRSGAQIERALRKSSIAIRKCIRAWAFSLVLIVIAGCGSAKLGKDKKDEFFTSGSREADQRASQTMAKHEQLTGSGEGAGEKGVKKAKAAKPEEEGASATATNKPAQVEGKLALFDRLGGETGISNIVADFTPRALNDPRVNWQRKGMTRGKFSLRRNRDGEVLWSATPENVAALQKHLVQFLALATGGPAQYDGKEMKPVHADMRITNPEFD
ncbi:MAG TPA: group 1 truncated hemoglobin, partial [Candidatus Limnocylindria bacterium]|nr:group 1 truncated hemoglobin [Candidatus Limnocylindria bacterium]